MKTQSHKLLTAVLSVACILSTPDILQAQPIFIPNHSFESPSTPFVSNNFDSWQKTARPAYFDFIEQNYGYTWNQMSGIFAGAGAYGNLSGSQGTYLFSFPQVGLLQDYDTMDYNDAAPTHDFNATFDAGKSYTLTLGVFGKGLAGNMTEGSMLGLSLYYRNGASLVTVGSPTIVTYSAAGFPNFGSLNLQDFQVNIPTVQAGDAWAGQHIGIKIESIYGTGDGYWDIDNVRLTAVPEPGSLGLIAVGGLLFALRLRDRR
jgi:PEP-CTERM motif